MPNSRIDEKVQQYTDILQSLDNDFDRYEFIMDLGGQLPWLPSLDRTEENRVLGCQSDLFVKDFGDDILQMKAYGDSHVVMGMATMILDIFNNSPKNLILETDPSVLESLGIKYLLTPGRQNGVGNLIKKIYECCES